VWLGQIRIDVQLRIECAQAIQISPGVVVSRTSTRVENLIDESAVAGDGPKRPFGPLETLGE
jgi:hypothetical protein